FLLSVHDTAPTAIHALSLHDALPISPLLVLYADGAPKAQFLSAEQRARGESEWSRLTAMPAAPEYLGTQTVVWAASHPNDPRARSEEHTSELQSRVDLVCRLLLEKQK